MSRLNKTALITGSAKGLGKSAALALAEQGFDIVINYLNSREEAEALRQRIESMGVSAMTVQADVCDPVQVEDLMVAVKQRFEGADVVVNNAGPFVRERRRFQEYAYEEVEHLVRGNLLAVMQLDLLALPYMRERRWGRIIHYGFGRAGEAAGWPHRAAYAAAKVGLVSFTKTLAVEEAEFGITVNMICPGDIRGDYKEKAIAEVLHETDGEAPRGRPGTGEDVARVIRFLCESASDFVTGNVIEVSGGLDPIRTLPLK